MSVEIAWKQNILLTDFHLLKSLLVVFGFGSQAFICGFSRQNINSAPYMLSLTYFTHQVNAKAEPSMRERLGLSALILDLLHKGL